MGLHKLGDAAWIFKSALTDPQRSLALILRLQQLLRKQPIPGIVDIVSSYDSIAVHFHPSQGDLVFQQLTSIDFDGAPELDPDSGRTLQIPVVYDGPHGPDLQALADACKLSPEDLIRLHSGADFTVAAIGFSPGFPYLAGLPDALRQPRHASPRPVAAGSVAVANGQAGIYPNASQGGWHVIGRTSQRLFDPHREDPSLLKPGDRVRFEAVEQLDFETPPPTLDSEPEGGIKVLDPGPLTSIQDHGRYGWQHIGVSPGGAVDPISATVANRLVGNPDDAAVLECTMSGPKLLFEQASRIAWVGWDNRSSGRPVDVKPGTRIDLSGRTRHLRGYIAVAGGIDVPTIMGSRSTDLRAGFGGHHGRALRAGDSLIIGDAPCGPVSGSWHVAWPEPGRPLIELRFIRGMHADAFGKESYAAFCKNFYQISPASDRMGTRLQGVKLSLSPPCDMVSQAVVYGTIQVPPDGQPIVLMSERQTIGGYPQIGHVISADLPVLARAWPGTRIHFREVTLDEARDAWFKLERELGLLHAGLSLIKN